MLYYMDDSVFASNANEDCIEYFLHKSIRQRLYIRFQRSVPESKEHRIDVADGLASAFKSYKIPLIVLEADDLDLVTKSFHRINSSGVAMGELHMLNALSYTEGFHLLDAIEERRARLLAPVGWDSVDSDMILLTIKRHLGFDPYKQNADQVSRAIRENQSELDVIFGAFVKAAKFLSQEFGIQDASQLPYKMQTVGV